MGERDEFSTRLRKLVERGIYLSKVLVGIATHNRAALLVKAIESALAQDYADKEVAVFDDASSDDTSLLKARFPEVSWSVQDTSIGCIQARNQLMRAANAEYFVSLDDDAWFMSGDEISVSVAFMNARPQVAALAYDIQTPDNPVAGSRSAPRASHLFMGCGHMLRLSAVHEVGGYPPGPGKYGAEESDLCIRLLDRDHEIFSLPGVSVWHDKSPTSRDVNSQYRSNVCNDLAFAYRRCPYPNILWMLPAKILRHFVFAATHGLVTPFWRGTIEFFKALPKVRSGRRPVTRATFGEFRRRARNAS
jgi:GT2 family glycosyltransferase